MDTRMIRRSVRMLRSPALFLPLLIAGCAGTGGDAGEIELFNGRDLTGWKAQSPDNNAWQTAAEVVAQPASGEHGKFIITPGAGILVNGPEGRTGNLLTEQTHSDCQAHIEFMVPKGSNSGIYFMGKYELQILDSFGKEKVTFGDCGGIYAGWADGKHVEGRAPRVNASRPPGEWQTFDVTFRGPRFDASGTKIANACFVKVVHNGKVIHENVELKGATRAAMRGPERPRGPLMIQGDHGPVAYRNLRIRLLD